jgi:hypothetical protein
MNKFNFPLGLALLFSSTFLSAQDLAISKTTEAELSKEAREGRYGGTLIDGNKATVLYVSSTKAEGVQAEQYDMDLGGGAATIGEKFIDANTAEKQLPWFMPRSEVEKLSEGNGKWLWTGRTFAGAMKLELGHIQKNYRLGVYTGFEFVTEEAVKPKAGDIWRITPGGFKSLSDYDALATSNGFYSDLEKYGNPLLMPADAYMLAAGVITEKVKLSLDQEFAANRVAVLSFNGKNLDDLPHDIYLLPYTAATVASGLGQGDDLCSLFAPLNGPTNVPALQHLYWKHHKNQFTLMRFSDDRKLVDSVSFDSQLLQADFSILNDEVSTYVIGKGSAKHDGWYNNIQYKDITGMQVTRVQDGKVQYHTFIGEEEMENKLVGPAGEKVKLDWYVFESSFKEVITMPNGEVIIIGTSPQQSYGLHLSANGELRALYYVPMMGKWEDTMNWSYQTMIRGDELILVANQRPREFATEAKVSTSTSTSSGAGVRVTTTTTTVKKLNEVFLQSQVVRINSINATMSNVLQLDGKDWYPMGSFPAMFTTDAIFFTGREKGPSGKVIHVARVDL